MWISFVPFRISFIIWTCYLDEILTLNHLQNRGWHLANRYTLCKEEEELTDHLFIHCPMAKEMWYLFISHFQSAWVFPLSFNNLISRWEVWGIGNFYQDIWHALPGAFCWGLWRERNNEIFEDKSRSFAELRIYIYNLLRDWISVAGSFDEKEWFDIWKEES